MPEKRTKKSNAPAAATKTAASDDDMPRPIGMTDTTMPAPGMGRGSASHGSWCGCTAGRGFAADSGDGLGSSRYDAAAAGSCGTRGVDDDAEPGQPEGRRGDAGAGFTRLIGQGTRAVVRAR